MGKRKKSKKVELGKTEAPTNNPFAAALAGMTAPEADLPEPPDDVAAAPASPTKFRARTRIERKGRGGKTVTLVEGLEALGADEREGWASKLKKALGVGVGEEAGMLVVQGDQRERVDKWFEENAS